jgi:hypothetical protein
MLTSVPVVDMTRVQRLIDVRNAGEFLIDSPADYERFFL